MSYHKRSSHAETHDETRIGRLVPGLSISDAIRLHRNRDIVPIDKESTAADTGFIVRGLLKIDIQSPFVQPALLFKVKF